MSFSNYLETAILNSLFGKTSDLGALASAPTIYVALCESAPTDTTTGSTLDESGYTSYARVSTVAGDWNSASAGALDNANTITFPTSTGGTSLVTHFALVDASSNGNVLVYGALNASKTIDSGDTASFAAGALDVALD